jgi:hypothetical protein
MVLQFYLFLNHVLRKTERMPEEHYGENARRTLREEPITNPFKISINLIITSFR